MKINSSVTNLFSSPGIDCMPSTDGLLTDYNTLQSLVHNGRPKRIRDWHNLVFQAWVCVGEKIHNIIQTSLYGFHQLAQGLL